MATLMDAFNAAAGAASPFLGAATNKLKEKHDLRLHNESALFSVELQDWLRDTQYTYNPDKPDEYKDKLNEFITQKFGVIKDQNTSGYWREAAGQLEKQALIQGTDYALRRHDQWRVEQADVKFAQNNEAYLRMPEAKDSWQAFENNLAWWKRERHVPAEAEQKARDTFAAALLGNEAEKRLGGVQNVNQLEDTVNGLVTDLRDFMPEMTYREHDETGKETGVIEKDFDLTEEQRRSLIEEYTKIIQHRTFNRAAAADAEREQDIRDYRVLINAGDSRAAALAQRIARGQYGGQTAAQWREGIAKNSAGNYSGDKMPQLNGMFGEFMPAARENGGSGGSGGGGASLTDIRGHLSNLRRYYGMHGTKHDMGWTYEQGMARYQRDVYDYLTRQGYEGETEADTRAIHDALFGGVTKIDEFMGDMAEFMKALDPQFKPVVLEGTKGALTLIANKKRLSADVQQLLINQVTAEMYNRVADMGINSFTHEEWIEWGKKLGEQAVSGTLHLSGYDGKSKLQNLTLKRQIEIIEQAEANPDIIGMYNGEAQFVGERQPYLDYQEFKRRDVARILGLGESDMANVRADWVREAGRQDDIIAEPQISVTSGPKRGTYRQAVREKDGKKEVITVKYDEQKKAWDYENPVSTETGAQTTRRQKGENAAALDRDSSMRGAEVSARAIAGQSDIRERQAEWNRATNEMMEPEKQYPFLEDELYMRGINPDTLEDLKSMPYSRYTRLLEQYPEYRDRIEKLITERGITVEGMPRQRIRGGL